MNLLTVLIALFVLSYGALALIIWRRVVGILGLGAVALRAVIERRRAIGVLRAVGFLRLQVSPAC